MAKKYSEEFNDALEEIIQAKARLRNSIDGELIPREKPEDIWRETPVSPQEFFTSPDFVGDLKDPYDPDSAVWPIVRDDISRIFSGPDKYGNPSYFPLCNTFLNISGFGCGKSATVAWIDTYYVYLLLCLKDARKYFGLRATFLFLNVAPTEAKANDIVFSRISENIANIPWFAATGNIPDPRFRTALKFYANQLDTSTMTLRQLREQEELEKKGEANIRPLIVIRAGTSSHTSYVGEDLICGIVDEACSDGGFETASIDNCEGIFHGMHQRRLSRFGMRGLVALISTAGNLDRFLEIYLSDVEEQALAKEIVKSTIEIPNEIVEFEGNKTVLYRRRPSWAHGGSPVYRAQIAAGETFPYTAKRELHSGAVVDVELQVPNLLRHDFQTNPEKALKDFAAIPQITTARYIVEWNKIISNLNRGRKDPLPDNGRHKSFEPHEAMSLLPEWFAPHDANQWSFIHIDLATGHISSGKDACGFCIGTRGADVDRGGIMMPTVRIDLSVRFKTDRKKIVQSKDGKMIKKEAELKFSHIREFVFFLEKIGFRIAKITMDGWQSRESLTIFEEHGFLAEQKGCTRESFETMKTLWYDGRLDIFEDKHALWELKRLQDNGRKVDKSPGSSDDEIECIARVCEMAIEYELPEIRKKRARPQVGIYGRRAARPGSIGNIAPLMGLGGRQRPRF